MPSTPLRIGLLRLTDSAPVLLAAADGFFASVGIKAEISIEPSWANIADKLGYGLLDAAVMLPPLALAMAAGLRGPPVRLIVPLGISQGGNTVVVNPAATGTIGDLSGPAEIGLALTGWIKAQPVPPRFGVVHVFSTHNLLLRHFLATVGLDPDQDLRITVVPPERVVDALAEGRIAGFCAGAPWGSVAEEQGAGRVLFGTSAIWPAHPEKCLVLRAAWAEANPDSVTRALRAVLAAAKLCDAAESAGHVSDLLAATGVAASRTALLACLPDGRARETVRFHQDGAWLPQQAHAVWFLEQMQRWGWLPPTLDRDALASSVYRPDLAALAHG